MKITKVIPVNSGTLIGYFEFESDGVAFKKLRLTQNAFGIYSVKYPKVKIAGVETESFYIKSTEKRNRLLKMALKKFNLK